jgi:hypothetical protein
MLKSAQKAVLSEDDDSFDERERFRSPYGLQHLRS